MYESKPLDHDANGEDVVCEEAGLAVVVVVAVPAVPDAAGFTAEAAWLVNGVTRELRDWNIDIKGLPATEELCNRLDFFLPS